MENPFGNGLGYKLNKQEGYYHQIRIGVTQKSYNPNSRIDTVSSIQNHTH